MNLLIIYASNSGSNYLSAKTVKEVLEKSTSFTIPLKKAIDVNPDELIKYDTILMCSPSWLVNGKEGQTHETILELFTKITEKKISLKDKRFAVFGCGDRYYFEFCGAVDIMQKFFIDNGAQELKDPLKIDSFYFNQEKNLEDIEKWAKELAEKLPVSSLV